MKTKVKRLSKRTLAMLLGLLMVFSCLFVGSITTANAYNVYGGRVYFDTQGKWASAKYIYCAIWYSNGNKNTRYLERLYNIPNTTVYTAALVNINRTDVSSMRFIGTESTWIPSTVNDGWRSYEDNAGSYDGKYYTAACPMDLNNDSIYYGYVTSDTQGTRANFRYDNNQAKYINDSSAKCGSTNYNNNKQTINVVRLVSGSWETNDSASKAGTVSINARYYSDLQSTSDLGNSGTSYNTTSYNNGALHSYATAKVESVASGYSFLGWFNSSGTLLSTDEDYTYYVTGATTTYARFFKPDEAYSAATPTATTAANKVLINKNNVTYGTPGYMHMWDGEVHSINSNAAKLTQIGSSQYYYFNLSSAQNTQSAIVTQWDNWNNNSKLTGDIKGAPSNGIFYYALPSTKNDSSNQSWATFTHLGKPSVSTDTTIQYELGDTVTLTATKPSTGTLRDVSSIKYSYYYSTDDGSTYKLIKSNTTSTSLDFYPPSVGKYKFLVTATDAAEFDTTLSDLSSEITVGSEGYYVTGTKELIGTSADWQDYPSKGSMTNSEGTVWTKTFKSVPAGTYEFRIQNLEGYIGEADTDYTITGNADAVAGGSDNDNVVFTLTGKSKVVITFDATPVDGKYPVTVNVSEIAPKTVTVYANSGGTVSINYDGATFDVEEGKNTKIKVGEGDNISLTATPKTGYTFSKWEKNLETSYSTTATINDETINDTTVYVADFVSSSGSGGSIDYDISGWSDVSSTYTVKYLIGNDSQYASAVPNGLNTVEGKVYQSGSKWFVTLSSTDLTNWKNINNSHLKFNLFQNTTSHFGNGKTVGLADGSSGISFDNTTKERDGKYCICVNSIDSSVSAIGILFDDAPGSGSYNITFYTSTSGGGSSSGDDIEYNAAVNYYAKDSNFYNQGVTDKNTYITTKTSVDAVEDLVTVDETNSTTTYITGKAVKGCDITVSTKISGTCKNGTGSDVYAADKYYVVGYSFNGITPEILSEKTANNSHEATYTCTYTIPADMTESYLEITPIYFLKTAYADNTAMFYINGYDDTIKNAGWGNTLFVYPFYRRYKNNNNDKSGGDTTFYGQAENFSGYPGQPVVNYGGQLYTQIPLTNDGSAKGTDNIENPIKGVTINNGYFDGCHQTLCKAVTAHHQTYDYDDFQKIYKEKQKDSNGDKYLHSIFFSFKYHAQDTANQHRLYNKTNTANSASRYNDTIASGTRLATSGTVSETTMENYPGSNNKWEDLTDALGNKVDLFGNTVTKTTESPLKVVSMGYEFNNSGEYATEWAVYYKNGSNYELAYNSSSSAMGSGKGLNSSIVPSALIMNTASNFSNYTAMDGDQAITGYKDLYTALKAYAGYPVEICYEHDAPIHYNTPPAYRCDGRWTYTTVNDFVKSNIKIEYKANGATDYVEDTFTNTNEGTTTKCKAYFTNSEYYGAIESDSELIDATENYTFKAEEGGSYEFVGWYAKDNSGKYQKIENVSDDLVADSPKTANLTFVARFDYVASGNLTITNTVASGQTGMATTYLGVTLINGTKETVLANVASNTSAVKIDKSYINSSSNYSIRIEIRTVPIGENTFKSYACNTTNGSDVKAAATDTDIYKAANKSNSSDSYEINVKRDIYNNTTTQVVKAIEYVSTLTPVTYNYTIKYNYTSRSYGDQAYTKTGALTSGQINDETLVTGTNGNKTLTDKLLQRFAPHESNFNSTINWNYASASGKNGSYDSSTNTYTFSVNVPKAVSTLSTNRKAYFTVPYELSTATEANGIAKISTYGSGANVIEYGTAAVATQSFEISGTYEQIPKASNSYNVTAPEKMLVSGDPAQGTAKYKFFKYWKFSTTKGKEIGRCYYPEFNYVLYENYNVEAVYSTDPGNYDTNSTFGTDYAADTSTSISYIGNSRNQWNNGDKGTNNNNAADMIYNDFIISYKPGGNDLINSISGAETGIIIQKLDEVTPNSSGKNSITLDDYAAKFSENELSTNLTKITNFAKSDYTSAKVNGNTSIKQTIATSEINNKNRIHYAYKMYNTVNGSDIGTKQYFYRVYSYMKVNGTTTVSSTPTYFCMYDIATE